MSLITLKNFLYKFIETSSVAAGFGRHDMPPHASNPDEGLIFDRLALKLVCESHPR